MWPDKTRQEILACDKTTSQTEWQPHLKLSRQVFTRKWNVVWEILHFI
jgi:hypothetical protein